MIIKKIEERMNLSLGSYGKELSTVRTGRANKKKLYLIIHWWVKKWIHNQDITVEQAVIDFGKEIKQNLIIKSFIKYKVGEGIEVKKTDFNEEVKSLAGA